MTANQIQYWNLQETKRSNAAREAETHRSNVADESERNRHNVRTENTDVYKLFGDNSGTAYLLSGGDSSRISKVGNSIYSSVVKPWTRSPSDFKYQNSAEKQGSSAESSQMMQDSVKSESANASTSSKGGGGGGHTARRHSRRNKILKNKQMKERT